MPPGRQYLHFLQEGFFETVPKKEVEGRPWLREVPGTVVLEVGERFDGVGG